MERLPEIVHNDTLRLFSQVTSLSLIFICRIANIGHGIFCLCHEERGLMIGDLLAVS
jgi:hypothetical protein